MTVERELNGYWTVRHGGHEWELADEQDAHDLLTYLGEAV